MSVRFKFKFGTVCYWTYSTAHKCMYVCVCLCLRTCEHIERTHSPIWQMGLGNSVVIKILWKKSLRNWVKNKTTIIFSESRGKVVQKRSERKTEFRRIASTPRRVLCVCLCALECLLNLFLLFSFRFCVFFWLISIRSVISFNFIVCSVISTIRDLSESERTRSLYCN